MRPTDIKPRHIYCNRGQGTVLRFVLGIGLSHKIVIEQADGTLGPVVTSISLRNNEGAILIPVD